MEHYDLVVIGGGAAGYFAAIQACEMDPTLTVLILEKSTKVLSKVRISGGGRCNVTHACYDPVKLSSHYPRGGKWLKGLFRKYNAVDVADWFAKKGVPLKTENDGRVFPASDSSETIIQCFQRQAHELNITVETSAGVEQLRQGLKTWLIVLKDGRRFNGYSVLVATGGSPDPAAYQWIEQTGHSIHKPIPSLFTFNHPQSKFKDLMGVSVPNGEVSIAGSKFKSSGPVLITHWGLSGPAVIRLSAWAAEYLYERNYEFTALVNWTGNFSENDIRAFLLEAKTAHGRKRVTNHVLFSLPVRLWLRLCDLAGIPSSKIWSELPQKNMNRLVEYLIRCPVDIKGKTTFKEEFVTCGGVSPDEVKADTLESRKYDGLFFAGEVLHIDGETGGFNFQAAWTTAYIAARGIVERSQAASRPEPPRKMVN